MPLGNRTQADQSFLEVVHASCRAPVDLIDAAQLTVTNRAKALASIAFFSSLLESASEKWLTSLNQSTASRGLLLYVYLWENRMSPLV